VTARFFTFDVRRKMAILNTEEEAIQYSAEYIVKVANEAIEKRGAFYVALSGGSTPKAIYKSLISQFSDAIDWSKVHLFFSDERAVGPNDPESNYKMAMDAGFDQLPIPKSQIHRMQAEDEIENGALAYEELLNNLPGALFDLVMLGMGDDGHTASLFPKTHGLHAEERLVIANFIPSKDSWRMSLTMECINHSRSILVCIFGEKKAAMVKKVFYGPYIPNDLPIQRVGTELNPALFVMDKPAAFFNFNNKS
jgi:6-phosphogluconolactonase